MKNSSNALIAALVLSTGAVLYLVASRGEEQAPGLPAQPVRAGFQEVPRPSLAELPAREQVEPESAPIQADGGSPDTAEPLSGRLAALKESILALPRLEGIEGALKEKYRGFEPEDYPAIYPFLRGAYRKEMFATLRKAVDSGQYISEIVPAGESCDFSKYYTPGESFNSVAHETEPLANGLVEYRIVNFDRLRFPEMYARSYEEVWVHDIIHENGVCPMCTQPGK